MKTKLPWVLCSALALASSVAGAGSWVEFTDETAARNTIAAARFEDDPEEKDFAWGDVDNDGDVDLVVVRKEPYTSAGKRVNFLFLNEAGVLTDRTDDFAAASDVPGDEGFNTPTNDRDVVLTDVNQDGWLDIVTAVSISDGEPKHIGHPRVYVNLGCSGACNGTADWLGFRHEDGRIPTMLSAAGQSGFNPRFMSVAAGDVTGDGYPDLWFSDHDSSGAGGTAEPVGADFDDRLLVNLGAADPGVFVDATDPNASGLIPVPGLGSVPFPLSAFGGASAIADMDGDGRADIVKQTSLTQPVYVGIAYNSGVEEGQFEGFETIYSLAPYSLSLGDLNNDDRLDIVVTDDGADRYLLNQGPDEVGAGWTVLGFEFQHSGGGGASQDAGFGGNSLVADLDLDGWNDVIIADVHDDIPGVTRRAQIYRNLGGEVGGTVTLQEQTMGSGCAFFQGNPETCIVASIPADRLEGTHDVAVLDLDGDGWLDLIFGRAAGTSIWRNDTAPDPAGAIEDGDGGNGQALLVDVHLDRVRLDWGASCILDDTDYAVYRGTFDPAQPGTNGFSDHGQVTCTTNGSTAYQFMEGPGNYYYLVAPHNGTYLGSLGEESNGTMRTSGSGPGCPLVQNVGACD